MSIYCKHLSVLRLIIIYPHQYNKVLQNLNRLLYGFLLIRFNVRCPIISKLEKLLILSVIPPQLIVQYHQAGYINLQLNSSESD